MDCNTAALTVKRVLPEIEPTDAVMIDVPGVSAVARPVALIVAVAKVPELQPADDTTRDEPSE